MASHCIHGIVRRTFATVILPLGMPLGVLAAAPVGHRAGPAASTGRVEIERGIRADRVIAPASYFAALRGARIPTFSRQTKLACSACHYQFPQLTSFGRMFKLNGYTLTGLTVIGGQSDTAGKESLRLAPIAPASVMMVASLTHTSKVVPGTQNNTAVLPQEMSLFLAGELSPKVGAFTQITYAAADGALAVDNLDFRFATHSTLAARDLLFGVTLHNNPTVQDVWNTAPAWGFPFMGTESAPTPAAAVLVDGGLGQQVLGLGAYSLYDAHFYAELTAYRSALQGVAQPYDATAANVTKGMIPYWRLALQHQNDTRYMMIGAYGFNAELFGSGVTGPTNRFNDIAADAQVEQKFTNATVIGRVAYIHESQQLDALVAAGGASAAKQNLSSSKVSVSYVRGTTYGLSGAWFSTTGSSDTLLYAPAAITGSRTGAPNSAGLLAEFAFNPWQNTRLAAQYVMYSKFNGSSKAYDVTGGRAAADNNTLFLYTWLAF